MAGTGGFRHRYTATTVPGRWKPFHRIYSYVLGALFFFYLRLVHVTSRVVTERAASAFGGDVFLASYHRHFLIYMAARPRHDRQVWMVLDSWYMTPMHLLARWSGVEDLVYVGVDQGGRRAQSELIEKLTPGRSTTFNPDGPSCDPGVPRKGLLHMAWNSGLPIVPVTVYASRSFQLSTWDRKVVPLPFSELRVRYGEPIHVTRVDDAILARLQRALAAPLAGRGAAEPPG